MPKESIKQALARLSLCHEAVHPQLVASQGLHDLVVTAAAAAEPQQQLQQNKMVTRTCGGIAAPCKQSTHSWSPLKELADIGAASCSRADLLVTAATESSCCKVCKADSRASTKAPQPACYNWNRNNQHLGAA
jgi:hypothetical protein